MPNIQKIDITQRNDEIKPVKFMPANNRFAIKFTGCPSYALDREASMIMRDLTRNKIQTLGGNIYREWIKTEFGLRGKLISAIIKVNDYISNADTSGTVAFAIGTLEKQREERAHSFIMNFIRGKALPKFTNEYYAYSKVDAHTWQGRGFKLRENGLELDKNIRKQIIALLDNSTTYKEIKEGAENFIPVNCDIFGLL